MASHFARLVVVAIALSPLELGLYFHLADVGSGAAHFVRVAEFQSGQYSSGGAQARRKRIEEGLRVVLENPPPSREIREKRVRVGRRLAAQLNDVLGREAARGLCHDAVFMSRESGEKIPVMFSTGRKLSPPQLRIVCEFLDWQ